MKEDNIIKEINLSEGKEYLTQLNNKFSPMSTCNTTSAIMGLMASGIEFHYDRRITQPEDALTKLLTTPEAYDRMSKLYAWAVPGGYEPYEVHGMLEWGINKFVGRDADTFSTKFSIMDILTNIRDNKCASMVSGKFTRSGHIIAVVGYRENSPFQTLEDIDSIIIDDPYGNYHSGYKNRNGDNILFTVAEFNRIVKSVNNEKSKWVHMFRK